MLFSVDIYGVVVVYQMIKYFKEMEYRDLNWKDINDLEDIINQVHSEFPNGANVKDFGNEVLERFRRTKEDPDALHAAATESLQREVCFGCSDFNQCNPMVKAACRYNHLYTDGFMAGARWKEEPKWKPDTEQLWALQEAITTSGYNEKLIELYDTILDKFY